MHHVTIEFVWCLFVCTSVVRCTDDLPRIHDLIKTCPRTFDVTRHGVAEDILVTLKSGQKYCKEIPDPGVASTLSEDDTLQPIITVNRNNTIDIAWTASACQDTKCTNVKRYPKKFILHLKLVQFHLDRNTTNNYEVYDNTCIKMRLDNRKVGLETKTDFFLNGCIPLVSTPNIFLSAKIWSLPDGKSNEGCSISKRSRLSTSRFKRATRCPLPSVQCSTSSVHPLSMTSGSQIQPVKTAVNTFLQCSQHTEHPVFRVEASPSCHLVFHFTYLRPHLYSLTLRLKQHDTVIEEHTFNQDALQNRSVEFRTTEPVPSGNFKLLFEGECHIGNQPSSVKNMLSTTDYMDYLEYNNTTDCAVTPVGGPASIQMVVIIAVIGSVGIGLLIGVIVFCLCRRQAVSSASATHSTAIKNNDTLSIPLQEFPLSHQPSDYGDKKDPKQRKPLLADPPGFNCDQGKHIEDLGNGGKADKPLRSLILSQPNCGCPSLDTISARLPEVLANVNLQVVGELPLETRLNWTKFAESAPEEFEVIIIVLSEALHDLCSLHNKERRQGLTPAEGSRLDTLLEERNYESIPCVVLDRIKSLSGSQSTAHTWSIIILASCDQLVHKFLDEHRYLTTANCKWHVVATDELIQGDNVVLSERLEQALVHSR